MGSPMKLLNSAIELRSTYPRWLSGPRGIVHGQPQGGHRVDLPADEAFDVQLPQAHFPRYGATAHRRESRWRSMTWPPQENGSTMVRPTMRRPVWRSSVNRVSHPASSAEATIRES